MSGAELVFLVFAAVVLAGAVVVVRVEDARRATWGFLTAFGGLAALHVLLSAPVVAGVHVLVAGAMVGAMAPAVAVLRAAPRSRPPGRWARVIGGLGVAVLAFVLISTMARQYVSYGADLDADQEFGAPGRIAADLFGRHVVTLEVLGLVLVVAVVAVVLGTRGSRAGQEGEG